MLNKIIRFIRGTAYIKITDTYPERFLYLCNKNKIPIFSIKKENNNLIISIPINKINLINNLASTINIKFEIINIYGVPTLIQKNKKRIGVLIGITLIIILPYIMNMFILNIKIVGNERLDSRIIEKELYEFGIHPGAYKKNIDTQTIERMLIINNKDISWAAVNLIGCTAEIKLRERTLAKDIIDTSTPCNIVAKKDGYIISKQIFEGQSMVKIGDSVKKGQILVSGITEDGNKKNRLVRSRAVFIAETDDEINIEIYKIKPIYKYIDTFSQCKLFFMGKNIFTFGKKSSNDYKTINFAKRVSIFGYSLPIEFTKTIYIEREKYSEQIDFTKAKKLALIEINNFEESIKDKKQILNKDITAQELNNKFIFNIKYRFAEDIVEEKEILFS